jgi:hypothetical protein
MTASDSPFWHLQAFLVLFPLVIVLCGLQITLIFTRLASSSFSCPFSFCYCVVWPSAKGIIRSRNLKARQHNNQKKKDKKSLKMPKGAIRSRHLKARQHNDQKKKDKKSLKTPNG